jgi:hypothetical protein
MKQYISLILSLILFPLNPLIFVVGMGLGLVLGVVVELVSPGMIEQNGWKILVIFVAILFGFFVARLCYLGWQIAVGDHLDHLVSIVSPYRGVSSPLFAIVVAKKINKQNPILSRFFLQDAAAAILPNFAIARCCKHMMTSQVDVKYSDKSGRAAYGQLRVCNSVHVCPVCGPFIASGRKNEIQRAVDLWHGDYGRVYMATFTLRHTAEDSLDHVGSILNQAYRKMKMSKAWINFANRVGLQGSIAATEYTHGLHGWHPHKHVLFFVRESFGVGDQDQWLKARWIHCVEKLGGSALQQALDVRIVSLDGSAARLSGYLSKLSDWTVGHELALANRKTSRSKGGMTPIMMLAAVAGGDNEAKWLFQEYAKYTYRKNHIVWSRGLKRFFGIVDETDSQVLAKAVSDMRIVTQFDRDTWYVILANRGRGEVLAAVEADRGGLRLLNVYLARLGLPPQESWVEEERTFGIRIPVGY